MKLSDILGGRLGKPVQFYPKLTELTGSVTATVLLGQLVYWTGKEADPDGWIYKTGLDLTKETSLTRREQETARKQLVDKGILYEKYKGVPRQLYFKIDTDKLDALCDEMLGTDNKRQKNEQIQHNARKSHYDMSNSDVEKTEQNHHNARKSHARMAESAKQAGRNPPSIYTENTAKSTSIEKDQAKTNFNYDLIDFDETKLPWKEPASADYAIPSEVNSYLSNEIPFT